MPKSRNTYNKGLNQDASRSKYDPSNYYDALNLRIVTHDGLSTGSIENEKGNALTFSIPNLAAETLSHSDGTTTAVPAQTNLQIIGWCAVNKYIVIFTTADSSTLGGPGQVWAIEYDENTNTVLNAIGGVLNTTDHLIYNGLLNFSTYYRIEAEGRYENSNTVRVYWTDNYNQLRTVNILDPLVRNLKADVIDLKPDVTFCKPTIVDIGVGSLPIGGKVQYAYRLISNQGAQTTVSPTSHLVSLVDGDSQSKNNPVKITGAVADSANSKSVTFNLKGLDLDYSIIEHLAVLYTTKDAPQIFKFGEESIPPTGELDITLSGDEVRINLTQAEFSLVTSGFDVCKTIDAKANVLVAGNIRTVPGEIDDTVWDARAYRFNSSQIAALQNSGTPDIILNASAGTPPWNTVPLDWDAINPYNNEDVDPNWYTNQQYKYQSDGVTIGGEGANVSYTFFTEDLRADERNARTVRRDAPFTISSRQNFTWISGETNPDGSPVIVQHNNVFKNFAEPKVEAELTGYTRGEVYRFGIEFYLKKGNVTFVKWIGDIRFPEPEDGYPVADGPLDSGNMETKSLGISFNIDVSAIANDVSGFRIVRAERPPQQRKRLGTGTILILNSRQGDNDVTSPSNKYRNSLYELMADDSSLGVQREVGINELEVNGNRTGDRYHLPDFPGFNRFNSGGYQGVHLKYPGTKQGTIFLSPLTIHDTIAGFEFKDGDYIKTLGYYQSRAQHYRDNTPSNYTGENQGWVWITRTWEADTSVIAPFNYEAFQINNARHLIDSEYINEANPDLPDSWSNVNDFVNMGYSKTAGSSGRGYPFSSGNQIYLMVLKGLPAPNFMQPFQMEWQNNVIEGTGTISFNGSSLTTNSVFRFKEVAYIRPLNDQYGGYSFEARSKQQYMSTGHFQPVTPATGTVFNQKVFGGDTYAVYWGKEYLHQYNTSTSQIQNPGGVYNNQGDRKMSVAVFMPVESPVNTELDWGRFFNNSRLGSNMGTYVTDTIINDEVYTQQNNSENKFFAKDFTANFTSEFPHRLWASETKIDGELIDSWREFKTSNILDVEGSYGPINKVINFQDKMYFYQDRAFGIASINERSVISDQNGVQLTLGTGDVLDDFRYISTVTGTVHQFCVVNSGNALYHYDVNLKKLYKHSQGTQPLSDVKGLSSFFANNVDNEIVVEDRTLRDNVLGGPVGIHGAFDFRHNRALFTFLNPKNNVSDFTVGFNEFINGFESFYSFTPGLYLNTGRKLLSVDPNDPSEAYLHDEGDYASFYGGLPNDTYITLMVAPNADIPKIFHNIEYNSEVSLNGVQIPNETLNSIETFNDYQTTGIIPLIVPTNVKRRLRHWRHAIDRDVNSTNARARMRDYAVFITLTYNNNNNKRLVLHDVIVSYTPSRD